VKRTAAFYSAELVAGHQSLRKDLKAALYLQVPRA
jgi:hypothetical protein